MIRNSVLLTYYNRNKAHNSDKIPENSQGEKDTTEHLPKIYLIIFHNFMTDNMTSA